MRKMYPTLCSHTVTSIMTDSTFCFIFFLGHEKSLTSGPAGSLTPTTRGGMIYHCSGTKWGKGRRKLQPTWNGLSGDSIARGLPSSRISK